MTIVHPSYGMRDLIRVSAVVWTLTQAQLNRTVLAAPTGQTSVVTGAGGTPVTHTYAISAVFARGEESAHSAAAPVSVDLNVIGNSVTTTWAAVTNAVSYNVYASTNGGAFGIIGNTPSLSFVDDNITPALGSDVTLFDPGTTNIQPAAIAPFEQRRFFAGFTGDSQLVVATQTGTYTYFPVHTPILATDRLSFRPSSLQSNAVRHLVPTAFGLLVLGSAGNWVVSSTGGGLSASTLSITTRGSDGASDATPANTGDTLLYAAARGGHVREVAFYNEAGGLSSNDVCLRAPHLFDGYDIADMAYAKAPYSILWAVSTSGKLLGLTYVPEQQIGAWHQHDTDGSFESVCTVSEGAEDAVYVVVKRNVNGSDTRYIERFASRIAGYNLSAAFFVDAGVSYSGAPITTISAGLSHLEGKTVSILADGSVRPSAVVTGGSVTLDVAASTIKIGLPFVTDIMTLPIALQVDGFGQGRPKNVNQIWARVVGSSAIFAGPNANALVESKIRTTEPFGSPPSPFTGEVDLQVRPSWNNGNGSVLIRHTNPLPLLLSSLTSEVVIGG